MGNRRKKSLTFQNLLGLLQCLLLASFSDAIEGSHNTKINSGENLPNIVILFADNLGYADIGAFGSPTACTPNVDRLADEGLKLNNWNSAAHLCSASRAALLTGLYPVRTGVFPGVFHRDAELGLNPNTTISMARYLKDFAGYKTGVIGKWHLGHRTPYQPLAHGFDQWLGVPYHMSGGSVDNHTCVFDKDDTIWLPLYQNDKIVEQPVQVQDLAQHYATASKDFIHENVRNDNPFFLYMAFSHVHQLCAPRDFPEQSTCQWASNKREDAGSAEASFVDAVEEMDWVVGEILNALDDHGISNNTFVVFTSDNGPWVAEQTCSGSKGPFEGRWLIENVDQDCTACPHDYRPSPTEDRPRRCLLDGTESTLDGVPCGHDSGLGSVWEANVRMPALARWPGRIPAGKETMALVSTLDVFPTIAAIVQEQVLPSKNYAFPELEWDGVDLSTVLFGQESTYSGNNRMLFFWRDGFAEGPLDPPYGRFDVVAVKQGRLKAWFWTKSAHYNDDPEVFHDPPLLFDVLKDPAEAFPLDPRMHMDWIREIIEAVRDHKHSAANEGGPLTLARDARYIPCVDRKTGCRTSSDGTVSEG